MITFLRETVPFGFVIVIAVKDEASYSAHWTKDDATFMATLGISGFSCPLKLG